MQSTPMFIDGIGNISLSDGVIRFDLVGLEQGSGSLRRSGMFLANQFPSNSKLKVQQQAISRILHGNKHGIKKVKMEVYWLPIKIV